MNRTDHVSGDRFLVLMLCGLMIVPLAKPQPPGTEFLDANDSLSKVAFAITGTKWNGPRFFGLRDKEDRSAMEARP